MNMLFFVISQNFVFVLAIKERKDKEERCHGLCAGDKEDGLIQKTMPRSSLLLAGQNY